MKMKTRLALAFSFGLLVLVPFARPSHAQTEVSEADKAGAHGGGHGGGHEAHLDPKKLAFQFINFGLLVAILGFFGGKAINGALAARYDQMKKDLDEASATREDALARLKRQEGRLANLEAEVDRLRTSIKQEAEQEQQRLLEGAEEKAKRIQDETRFLVDQQVKEAERTFRQEVAAASARIAEDLVRRSVRPEDQTRLDQAFIADLESGKGASA
jgi:F0F1-type ATP synthase membrane subunit b/b'